MSNPQMFERNLGFMSVAEQNTLDESIVAIAGAGGDGGMLALQLTRMGVGGLRLADPDPFEIENTNRQAACHQDTIGVNKAVAVGEYAQKINPDIRIEYYTEGINRDNVADFVEGASLVIDETEFTLPELGVMIARESRPRKIPVMTALNIGFGALVTTFDPSGTTLETVLGLDDKASIDAIAEQEVPLERWLPYLPAYVDLSVFTKVASGEKSAPSIAPGVALAAGMGATQAFLNLVGDANNRPKPVYARKALAIDLMAADRKIVKFGRSSFYRHLAKTLIRNKLSLNPQASY